MGKVSIPKRIMQTWKTTELPDHWKPSQVSIQTYMPDWEYVLMTDEMNRNFIQEHFPTFLSYYDAFPYGIQRADAIRYAVMYVHGGLYLDCDFELKGPLDELFTEDADLFLLASSNTPSVITNGFMAARPGHQLWLDMIEEMKKPARWSSIERHLLVMYTTGPMAFNSVVKRTGVSYVLLPSAQINPCTLCEKVCEKDGALVRALEGSSWVGGAAATYQWCYCNSWTVALIVLIVLIVLGLMIYFKG
jgi:mannosyltransferase OCH1-like enzyme